MVKYQFATTIYEGGMTMICINQDWNIIQTLLCMYYPVKVFKEQRFK